MGKLGIRGENSLVGGSGLRSSRLWDVELARASRPCTAEMKEGSVTSLENWFRRWYVVPGSEGRLLPPRQLFQGTCSCLLQTHGQLLATAFCVGGVYVTA